MTGMGMRRFRVAGGGAGGPFGGGFSGNAQDLGDIFGDLFGEMFNMGGGGRKASRVQRGRDLRYDLTLEFEEAVFGKEKEITIRRLEMCDGVQGHGRGEGQGSGDVHAVRRAWAAEISAGVLLGGADVLACAGDGHADRGSVPDVQGRDAGAAGAQDLGEGAGGRGAGYADSLLGRGRGGQVWRAGGRLVRGAECEGAQVLRA